MSISVVIPLYNKERSIASTLLSVLSQEYQDFEVIVVNDGSSDDSAKIVRAICDNRLQIVDIPNQGVAHARHVGITKAKNQYIALIDGDDLWLPTYLSAMANLAESCPEAMLLGAAYSFQYSESHIVTPDLCISAHFKGYVDQYWQIAKDNVLFTSSSVLFQRDAYFAIGGYNQALTYGEDIDLWFRFALHYRVAFVNEPLVMYRLHAENRSNIKKIDKRKSLIWNLQHFATYEQNNPMFKSALDGWRMANIKQYLCYQSCDIDDIRPILRDTNITNRSFIWRLLKIVPPFATHFVYDVYTLIRKVL